MPSILPIRDAIRALIVCAFEVVSLYPMLIQEAKEIPFVAATAAQDELALVSSDLHGYPNPCGRLRNGAPPAHLGRYTSFNYLALLGSILAGKDGLR
jgi:hypothetical protein